MPLTFEEIKVQIRALTAERDALLADKRRLDWLAVEPLGWSMAYRIWDGDSPFTRTLREAIDAAMKEQR